jgi:replicative DNA helicase
MKPSYFNDDDRQESFKVALRFFKEYEKIPNKKELRSYLDLVHINLDDEEFSELYAFNLNEYNYDYLYKYVRSFILLRNLNLTVFDLLTYLKTTPIDPGNIDNISEKIRNDISNKLALNFSSVDSGLNFFNPEAHIQISKTGSPTGFPFLDKVQGGGWNSKALVVFQGRPKVGKSMVLGNIAARSFLTGNATGLVTVELADRAYMKRIGSNILSIKSEDYARITDEAAAKLIQDKIQELKDSGRTIGELVIKEFPTGGATAIDIENYFVRLEQKMNKKIKAISEELRGVAMRNEWCIVSATQIRREDIDNFDLGMDSVAESFGLIHTVDALFGLMRSPLESRMKIKVIANRDNGYEESYKFYTMHKDYFRLSEEVGQNSEFYSDDEEVSRMADELRSEYSEINNSPAITTVDTIIEDDYDALFNSI